MAEFKIDVSRRGFAENSIPAMLVLNTFEPTVRMDARGALARFRRAVSQWLANSEAGKASWRAAGGDFNYGDFREDDVATDPDFIRFAQANGLESVSVERFTAEDLGEDWDSTFEREGE